MYIPDCLTAKVMLLAASIFGTAVQGHMIMAEPVPYGYETIDNSPLTGSNYPCKVTSDPATFYSQSGIDNTYAAGSSQTLSFKGSAVHGGGSCQLAITNDIQPSAGTDWRVILSIESGCPTTDGTNPGTYNWTVPADLEPGQYSFAWTWISKEAGQPEYYMNCAPLTVTAGSAKAKAKARRDATLYPELFVANLDAINSCKTTPSTDPVYPDPGPNVEKLLTGTTAAFASVTQTGCVPKSQTQGSAALPVATAGGAAGSNTTATATAVASSSPTESSASSSSSAADISGSGFATSTRVGAVPSSSTVVVLPSIVPITSTVQSNGTATPSASAHVSSSDVASTSTIVSTTASSSAAAGSTQTSTSSAPTTATASASASATQSSSTASTPTASTSSAKPTATPTGSGSSNSTGSGGGASTKSGTCTDEGTFNCVGSKYQQCASGAWTSMQDLPSGTTCTQGESSGLWARRDVRGDIFNFRKLRRGRRTDDVN